MKDDLDNIKGLGQELFAALKNITEHGQIGNKSAVFENTNIYYFVIAYFRNNNN